jgi:hypothetical protein
MGIAFWCRVCIKKYEQPPRMRMTKLIGLRQK